MSFLSHILISLLTGSLFFHSLPSETTGINIETVCQDSLGTMWFGGLNGLVSFDGSRYSVFRHNIPTEHSIPDDRIYKIFCNSAGKLLVAHISGLSVFEYATGAFHNFPSPDGIVSDIVQLSESRYLAIVGSRLWLFDSALERFSREQIPDILSDLNANTLYTVGDTIYIGSIDGRIIRMSAELTNIYFIPADIGNVKVNCILPDSLGHIWAGTEGQGLWEMKEDGSILNHYRASSRKGGLSFDYVRVLCRGEDGAIWIGTKNGLNILKDGRFEVYYHDYYNPGSITHDSVWDIYCDRQGTMWLGTYYGGVSYCNPMFSQFTEIPSRPGNQYLNGRIISDIAEDSDGSLWIGTNSGDLSHMRTDGSFDHIKGLGKSSQDQPDIKCIYISRYTGRIFIGSDNGELLVLNKGSRQPRRIEDRQLYSTYAIQDNGHGGFFVGTQEGLFDYDEMTGRVTRIQVADDLSKIKVIELDSQGLLWIGKKFGATALKLDTWDITPLPKVLSEIKYVEDIHEDCNGRIWLGSSEGLYCYNRKDGSVRSYTVQDGMPDNVIHGIEEDSDGILWVSTNNGLCRLDPTSGDKCIFTVADGLPDNRFTTYAHCRTSNGEMYFGGLTGLVRFNPSAISITHKAVPPIITGIEVNGVRRYPEGNSIVLKPKERDICILFSAPDFISGENGRFLYQLGGVNSSWREAGKDRRAVYYGLAHGSYTFLLAYRNSSGIRNPENLEFHFKILPYWYETMLARMIAVLLVVALVAFFIMRLLARKKKEYQTEMEKVRNKLLSDFSLEFISIGAGKSPANETSVAKVFHKGDEDFMRAAMQVVKENIDNPDFSVEALASAMNMSRSNLHLRVKALFGVSSLEFIKTVRLNEACRLLLERKQSISEIAYATGFATPSYFAATFRHVIGCTPTEYIKRNTPA